MNQEISMKLRPRASLLLLTGLPLALMLAACNKVQSISITPGPGIEILTAVKQTAQYTALATEQMGSGAPTTANITNSVNWSTSDPNIATIDSSGLATAQGAGYVQITAESNGVLATSDLTVNIAGSTTGTGGNSITSITVIPGAQSVALPSQTSLFHAFGTTSSGATVDLDGQVIWSSSSIQIATVDSGTGLAKPVSQGTATITALYTNAAAGTVVTGSATFTVSGGSTETYTAVTIMPGSQTLSASGQPGQFIALATSGSTGLQTDVTSSPLLIWSSSIKSVADFVATGPPGYIEGKSVGNTTITAELTNPDGSVVSNTANVTVTSTPAPEPLLSLTIIPSSITVGNLQDTGQFLAIGTYATAPYVRDLTNSPNLAWISDVPSVFPVDTNSGGNSGATAGIATAYGNGSAVIIAEATNPTDGTIQTATATFNCPLTLPNPTGNPPTPGTCYPGSQAPALLDTLTIYNEGLNTTSWEITAPSATGTANVIHCGPGWALNGGAGGSVCTATYPLGATVVMKATGGAFGGWSYNCAPSDATGNTNNPPPITTTGPNYCTVTFTAAAENSNVTVGGIFN
jgi:uncharacterized protein YjdB